MPSATEVQLTNETRGLLAIPDGPPLGACLLVPMLNGLGPQARTFAASVVDAGFAALTWDPYPGLAVPEDSPLDAFRPLEKNLRDDTSLDQQRSLLDHLEGSLPGVPLLTMGWCMGGRHALLLAAQERRLAGCVAYHPTLRHPPPPHLQTDAIAVAPKIACPVMAIYPGQDHLTTRESWQRLRDALEARSALTSTIVLPQAHHGFMDPNRHGVQANAHAARFSWPQAVAFMKACVA